MRTHEKILLTDRGQGFIEYALIITLVVITTLLALALMGEGVANTFCKVAAGLGVKQVCSQGCNDDFSSMEGWELSNEGWEVKDGQMCNTKNGERRAFNSCSQGLPSNDYTIKIDSATLDAGNGYGVWFRSHLNEKGEINGYTFQYDPGYGGGAFIFRKWVNGRELAPFAVKYARNFDWHDTPHDIQIEVTGNVFKAYVDGELVLVGTDDTYSDGDSGLRTWDSTRVCLNNFSIEPTWP